MEHHAGLDVSLKETSVCIVDGAGKIIRETKVASEPEALVGYFSSLEIKVVRIGLEAGPLSPQGAGEILTADGRARGHEHDGTGLRLGAATQAMAADPTAKGVPGQLRAGPACPVPSTAGGVLIKPVDPRQCDRASSGPDRSHVHGVVRGPERDDG